MARLTTTLEPNDPSVYTSDKKFDLGGFGITPDGRKYRYGRQNASTAAVAGKLYQSNAQDTTVQALAIAAAPAGTKTITTTTATATVTKDQLAGGYVVVVSTPGQGFYYKITGNTAATTAVFTITLEEPIVVALTTGSVIDIIADPYGNIEIMDATNHDGMLIGVAASNITASYYGWYQVAGPCGVLSDGTMVVGEIVVASNGTDGAVEVGVGGSTEIQAFVGQAITAIATAEYGMIDLMIS
jgi:Tfp pilus assembly major pilin PilA